MGIAEWLASLGLGSYAPAFRDNHIDLEDLPSLTMDDLKEIGVASLGHRRRILAAIGTLQKAGPVRSVEPPDVPMAAERRQVTVLFADIAGFSSLSTELDAEHVHALLSAFFGQVDRIISDFGGRIDKHIGDCAMAVFGAPIAHSDDVRRAVAAALAIHQAMDRVSEAVGRRIDAHVGIASGEVVASHTGSAHYAEYTVTGETVNLASRLTDLAENGETVASADIVNTLAEAVEADFGGSQVVKGFANPVDIWRVRRLKDVAPAQRALVGRDAELARCEAALLAARDRRHGSAIYLRGEPGIGKSSLAGEVRKQAERLGFTVARVAVFDFGTGLDRDPLRALALSLIGAGHEVASVGPAVQAFADAHRLADDARLALKDLAGLPHSPDEHRLLDAMSPQTRLEARSDALIGLAAAAAGAAPLLIVVEDIHWADAVTLAGLAAVAGLAVPGNPVAVLMTSRIEGDPLARLQSHIGRAPQLLIELTPLSEEDTRKLAVRLLDMSDPLIEQCVARASGNPLFLEHLIRHAGSGGLGSAIPGSIRSVVTAQIDRLEAPDKTAVQAASILGTQFSIDAVRRLLGRPDWNPQALVERRLVSAENGAFNFSHALVRDGVYASILNAERRRLHLAAAEWFSGRDPVLRAEHLAKADDPGAVAAYLAAVELQVAAYRLDEALGLLERAGAIAREPAAQFAVFLQRGHLLTEAARTAAAVAAFDQALDVAPSEADAALARLGKAGVLRLTDRNAEALALLDQAEPVLAAAERTEALARLEHLRGNLLYPLGQAAACQAAHERALAHAERCGSVELEALALGGLGDAAIVNGRPNTAQRLFAQCVDLAHRHGLGRTELANAPMLASLLPDPEAALAEGRRIIAAARAAHQLRAELTGHHFVMARLLYDAKPEAVEAQFDRAEAIVRQMGARRFRSANLAMMAEAHRQLGDRDRASAMLDEALAVARETVAMSYFGCAILGFRALLSHHDPEVRLASLREGEGIASQASVFFSTLAFFGCGIESCILAKDWGEVRRLADRFAACFPIEQPPAMEFLTERARLLADAAENGVDRSLQERMERCRDHGRALGYALFLPQLSTAQQAGGRQ